MSLNQDKNLSLLHGVSLNDKDKVIWTKSFQTLQQFVKEVLNLSDGVWSSPGGDAKQYKSKEIDIRWYPDTQSITLAGKLKDELKLKLISLASISEQLAKTPEASDHDDYSDGHESHVASPTHPDVASPTNSDTTGGLQNVVETFRIVEMKTLKNQLTKFQNATNSAIKDLREASIKISDEDENEDMDKAWPDIADTITTHALNATKMVAIFQKIICMRKIKKQKKTTFTA
jgi:hypothetical protein